MIGDDHMLPGNASENVYQELYKNSPEMYRTVNRDGVIILCNRSYAEKLGYSTTEIIGSTIFEHTAEKSKSELDMVFQKWRNGEMLSNHELWLKRKNGTEFPVLLSVNSLYDKIGNLIGSNTVIKDITEIYEARKEISDLKTKRFATIGELSARIAHDLRSPLTVIKATLHIINEINDPYLEKYAKYFQKIDRATMRISHQVEEVMDYVKPKPLVIKSCSVSQVISNVVDRIGKNERVTINLPENDTTIDCDEEKLEIVLVNLILNAIQAMNYQGTINIRLLPKETTVSIDIEDTGPGIPDELKPKIFEPLFTTRQIGTGLGLPSCKTIVEKHGGTISFTSEIGRGTTFTIELPKLQPTQPNS